MSADTTRPAEQANPFAAPERDAPPRRPTRSGQRYRYAGFWIRFLAVIIDGIILGIPSFALMYLLWGDDYLNDPAAFYNGFEIFLDYGVPLIYSVAFWVGMGATPGKLALGLKVIDANTGEHVGVGKAFGRYFAYILSGLVLCIGYIIAAFDDRKRSLHDRLATTYVIHARGPAPGRQATGRRTRRRAPPPANKDDDEGFARHEEGF